MFKYRNVMYTMFTLEQLNTRFATNLNVFNIASETNKGDPPWKKKTKRDCRLA